MKAILDTSITWSAKKQKTKRQKQRNSKQKHNYKDIRPKTLRQLIFPRLKPVCQDNTKWESSTGLWSPRCLQLRDFTNQLRAMRIKFVSTLFQRDTITMLTARLFRLFSPFDVTICPKSFPLTCFRTNVEKCAWFFKQRNVCAIMVWLWLNW